MQGALLSARAKDWVKIAKEKKKITQLVDRGWP